MFSKISLCTAALMLVICSLLPTPSHARKGKFTHFSFRGNPTAYKSNNKAVSAGFSIIGAQGKMGNGLDDAPDRDMYFMPVQLFLGFRIMRIRIAAAAEYMQASQITQAAEVGNTNVTGTGISFGPRIDYYDGKQSFGGIYRTSTIYQLEKPDINNTMQEYKATTGFTVQYTRRLSGRLGVVLDYSEEEFSDSLATAPIKWNRAGIGLTYSNFDLTN